ncbi:MAG: NAD(P)-binding domain-containing protein [Chloroflexota bacterium]|nr:NAD(P)-binding domain-containing protein [Chloroflexota bacterium]
MKIGVIGSGLMGSALGTSWAHAGHQVLFSYSRDRRKLETLAHRAGHGAAAVSPAEAASADAVLIAVPWRALEDALAEAGSLRGRTVITCMLPMTDDDERLAVGFTSSGAETLAQKTGAHVVAAFNTVWSDVIRSRMTASDAPPSLFYVGDDASAKATAVQLIRDAKFDPVDAGSLQDARLLEPFGLLMGKLGFAYNPQVAYRFLKP